MDNEVISIQFNGRDFDMILRYQEESGATTVQNAILNAISVAFDHPDGAWILTRPCVG